MFQHQEKKETLVILRLCLMASIISLHMPRNVLYAKQYLQKIMIPMLHASG